MAWQLGTTNIESTNTGSLYMGTNEVKKVYKGQLQVYPDFVPFPNTEIFDWWIGNEGIYGVINGNKLAAGGGFGNDAETRYDITYNEFEGFKGFNASVAGEPAGDNTFVGPTTWNNSGSFTIAVGRVKNKNVFLDGGELRRHSRGGGLFYNEDYFGFTKEQEEVPGTPTDSRYYYSIATNPLVYSPTGSLPPTIGFAANSVFSGSREIYMNSSTPLVSTGYPYSVNDGLRPGITTNFPGAATNGFITEIIILTEQPSTAELDEYRQYVSAKYGIIA